VFEKSILKNKRALHTLLPDAAFKSFSYPVSGPRPLTKRRVAKHFDCCRGGGQTFNSGIVDLNSLSAYFLEKSRDWPEAVEQVIDLNCRAHGWLILATHDVSDTPTPYGCSPVFFERIVRYAMKSGAGVVPVGEAWRAIRDGTAPAKGGSTAVTDAALIG
jgi:hypothetical protein